MTRAQSEEHDTQGDRMQARIHALEHQLQHLLSIQGQPNPARSVQQRSAPPPIKLDLHSVTGEETQAAREFARQARLLAAIAPDDNDEYLINVVGAKMSGTAAYWFDTRRQDFPNENFEELIEAFSQQFVEAHDVQQVVLASLHSAEQVGSLKELYAYMTSRIVTLKEKPRQAELIMIYLRALRDPAVRSHVLQRMPTTLHDAHQAALQVNDLHLTADQYGSRAHQTQPFPHDTLQLQAARPFNPRFPLRPNPQTFTSHHAQPTAHRFQTTTRLSKLDDHTRELCIQEGRCLRCRQHGHWRADCPLGFPKPPFRLRSPGRRRD